MWNAQVEEVAVELCKIFTDTSLVDEVAFIPSASPVDVFGRDVTDHPLHIVTSSVVPNAFMLAGHKLAIARNFHAPLYVYASASYMCACAPELGSTNAKCRACFETGVDALVLLPLLNGDHSAAWNGRKRRIKQCLPKLKYTEIRRLLEEELQFSKTVLSGFPKSQAVWAHRRWVMNFFQTSLARVVCHKQLSEFFVEEALVVERANSARRLNYAAWLHRRYCSRASDLPKAGLLSRDPAVKEVSWAKARATKNVSDYCGLHYIQTLMRGLPDLNLEAEMSFVVNLIEKFPGFEALWLYRRQLFASALDMQQKFSRASTYANIQEVDRSFSIHSQTELGDDKSSVATGITLRSELSSTLCWLHTGTHECCSAERQHLKQAQLAAAYRLWIISLATRSLDASVKMFVPGFGNVTRATIADAIAHSFSTPAGLLENILVDLKTSQINIQ